MTRLTSLLIKVLPWALLITGLMIWVYSRTPAEPPKTIINSTTVLKEMEAIGNIELVRYNFKEITELTEVSKEYLRLFKLGPDQKIALISTGQAAGCIDLTKMNEDDIRIDGDSVYIRLPEPEICYYKLDLDKTRIYSLQTNPLKDDKTFIQKAYRQAEQEIRKAALKSGILGQTKSNAEVILRPLLEEVSGKTVFFNSPLDAPVEPFK